MSTDIRDEFNQSQTSKSVFNHSQEHSMSFSPRFCKFDCNTSDWSLQTTISNLMKNGRKLPKRLENTVGKEEIAPYQQFLLSPQCFQKSSTADT